MAALVAVHSFPGASCRTTDETELLMGVVKDEAFKTGASVVLSPQAQRFEENYRIGEYEGHFVSSATLSELLINEKGLIPQPTKD